MTIKLVVLYTQPDDADGFAEHYLGVHAPLVNKIPGLQRFEGARIVAAADGGEQTFFRIAELYFADQAALEAALGSEEGRATGRRLPADRAAWIADVRRRRRRLSRSARRPQPD